MATPANSGTKVIIGHYGLAAGAKSVDHRAPLWSLMLATQWLDVVFIPLFLLGIETIETLPGGGYGTVVIHADYTHSLIGALVLSAAFGAVAWWRWDRRLGLLLGAVAFSHWCLISSCTAAICRFCLAMPAIFHYLVSGFGECPSCRSRSRRRCFCWQSSLLACRKEVGVPTRQPGDSHAQLLGFSWPLAQSFWRSTR